MGRKKYPMQLTVGSIKILHIPIPNFDEQKRIVSYLQIKDEKILKYENKVKVSEVS